MFFVRSAIGLVCDLLSHILSWSMGRIRDFFTFSPSFLSSSSFCSPSLCSPSSSPSSSSFLLFSPSYPLPSSSRFSPRPLFFFSFSFFLFLFLFLLLRRMWRAPDRPSATGRRARPANQSRPAQRQRRRTMIRAPPNPRAPRFPFFTSAQPRQPTTPAPTCCKLVVGQ